MLLNQLQFQNKCQQPLTSIQNPQRQKHKYMASINNPMTQQFTNLKLASTISKGRSTFQKELQQIKQEYIARTEYIRINDSEVLDSIYEVNLQKMKKKYSKYHRFEQMNIPKGMLDIFHRFGYEDISQFMRMAAVNLLFESKSLLQYDNRWDRDAIIALMCIAHIKVDSLNAQVIIICPDDEHAIQLEIIIGYLNIYNCYIHRVSNKNSIVDDRKYLKQAQIVLGRADRINYVMHQKYLTCLFLDSVIIQEFSMSSDLGYCNDISNIIHMLPKSTSIHYFFSQVFSEAEHQILNI